MKKRLISAFQILLLPVLLLAQTSNDDFTQLDLALAFASKNSVDGITMLVKNNLDINKKHPKYSNCSILHVATENNAFDVVSYIVDKGGIIDIENDNKVTPFEIAVSNDYYTIASYLLKKGADINHYNLSHRTPLFHATIYTNLDAIEFLLKNGADMYTEQYDCATALHIYLLNLGNSEGGRSTEYDSRILMAYQKNGFDVSIKDMAGYNLIHTLSMQNLRDPWLIFEEQITNYNDPIPEGYTPLFMSIATQNFNSTKFILEHGVDVNSIDPNGATPIFYAVINKNKELFSILSHYKLDLSIKDKTSKTVFDYADDEFKKLLNDL